jgi:uncharacterized protein
MKIAVIGSTGRAGSRIVSEARGRGHEVTGISRSEINGWKKDLWDLTSEDVKCFDAVISAFATWEDQTLHLKAASHLDKIMSGLDSRWIAVGGAGSLLVSSNLKLKDSENFPADYKNVADGMAMGLDFLLSEGKSNWSYFSPSAEFDPGERTGKYRLGDDYLLIDAEGESNISMEDYAIAMIDVLEQNKFNKKRFTAISG